MTNRILIYVEGGVIQHIVADQPVDIFVADYDVEGADADMIATFFDEECLLGKFDHGVNRVATSVAATIVSERGDDK